MDGLVDRIRYRLRDAKHHQKQDSYGGLYDADNGVMLTGEISQDMLGGYNKTVLQYANKGPAQNMVSRGGGWYDMWNYVNDATGYRVINTGLIPITEKFSINHVLTRGSADDITDYTDKTRMLSLVARGQYQFTDYVRLIGEVGGFYQKDSYNNGTSYKQAGEIHHCVGHGGRARLYVTSGITHFCFIFE